MDPSGTSADTSTITRPPDIHRPASDNPPSTPDQTPHDWREYPAHLPVRVKTALSKRLLRCETIFGVVCGVHLEKVNISRNINASLGKHVYTWVFEARV